MAKELNIRSMNPDQGNQRFSITDVITATFRGSRIVFATSVQNQQVVIKIPTDPQGAKREWLGLTKAGESGISVPAPIMLGLTDSDLTCIILERIDGEPLFLSNDYKDRVILGQVVRQMHSGVSIDESMWRQSDMVDYSYYDRQLKLWGNDQSQIGIDSPFTLYLFQLLSQPMDSYCNTTAPVFNHNDIHDGQVIKSARKSITLIDFENWTEDRSLNDLGFYLFHCLRTNREFEVVKSFMRGYLEGESLSENDKLALIFNLLFISTRAVFRYFTYQTDYLETARGNHQKVLNFIRTETLWKAL